MSERFEILCRGVSLTRVLKTNNQLFIEKLISMVSIWKTGNYVMILTFILTNFFQLLPFLKMYFKYRRYSYRTCNFNLDLSPGKIKEIKSIKCDGRESLHLLELDPTFRNNFYSVVLNAGYSIDFARTSLTITYENVIVKFSFDDISTGDMLPKKLLLATNEEAYRQVSRLDDGRQIRVYQPQSLNKGYTYLTNKISFDERLYPLKVEIQRIIEDWKTNKKKFSKLGGLPMNFLFTGPPGTGKSVLATSLARLAGLSNVSYPEFNRDGKLNYESDSVVIFDDLDILHAYKRDEANIDSKESVYRSKVLSTLMSFLDSPPNNVFVVITTNYPEKLDPVLFRPGRITHHFKFDRLEFDNCKSYAEDWYGRPLNLQEKHLTSAELITLIRRAGMNVDLFVRFWMEFSVPDAN